MFPFGKAGPRPSLEASSAVGAMVEVSCHTLNVHYNCTPLLKSSHYIDGPDFDSLSVLWKGKRRRYSALEHLH